MSDPRPRVVLVDGVPMSGLIAAVDDPRGVIVAFHGGASTAAYFDCPGHPRLSLLRRRGARIHRGGDSHQRPAGLRELLWQPAHLYPADVLSGMTNSSTGALYEAEMVKDWPRQDFPAVAGEVRVPVQFSVAEYERVWKSDPEALAEIAAMFPASPRFVINEQIGTGHNLSLSVSAAAYHLKVLSFVEDCVVVQTSTSKNWRRVDARRIHRTGQPGRPHGTADRRGRLRDDVVGPQTGQPRAVRGHRREDRRFTGRAGAASDLVCLCVVGDDDVREVLYGETGVLAGLASGGIVAIHSTVHPDTCREIAEKAATQGVSVIDAPVSGGGPAVEEGKLLVMVGGDEDVVERCRPVFATYADPIVHLGPLGSGQVTKILNNLLFTANLGSAISTLELGDSLGIERTRLAEVLNGGSAISKALGSIAVFGGTLEGLAPIAGALLQKDVRHAASLAANAPAPEGAVFDAADAALKSMDYPR